MEVVAKGIFDLCAIYTKYFNVKRRIDYPDQEGQFDDRSFEWELCSFEKIINSEGLYEWYDKASEAWVKGTYEEYQWGCEWFEEYELCPCYRQDEYELWEFEIDEIEGEDEPIDIPLGLVRK